jgi:hypothetical protein
MKTSSYGIVTVLPDAVFLVDYGHGKSVTNDAENVVESVNDRFPNHRIFYRDTMGCWDELVHIRGLFLKFAPIVGEVKEKYKQHFI